MPELTRIAALVRERIPVYAERDEPFWEAAVALVIRQPSGGEPELLFIERAVRQGDPWSGQVALPGGRRDANEADLVETAVRETFEETGLDLKAIGEVAGPLDEHRPRTPVLPPVIVRPYVAIVRGEAKLQPNHEVAGHFWAPLRVLFDPENTRKTRVRTRGAFWIWHDAIHYNGKVIWGMTQRMVKTLEKVAK
ncbi:MAG: CoA pyrophosphatase [Gemmatimonadetes bacterium]|nr:CoA pyrophosphatase [Gemmatimonadota bacterium]